MKWRIAVLSVLLLACLRPEAWATVTANSVVTSQTPTNGKVNFVQGTDAAGTYKTVYTAGANGSRCNGLEVANNDGSASHVVTFEIVNGGVSYPLSSLTTVPASVNNVTYSTACATMPSTWAGLPLDSDGNPTIQLVSGDVLKATYATALTTSDQIGVFATCSDF